eukprot:CAMPEP_0198645736 /NCGR_PEP_ID=MMETSP1467-20131203/1401_1 /TAXON_ID=1462469 /ORGANISM="unid. sp., Strain CCMP2135" /LENGTH=122 /DNA_ID=CAMNT_0044381231 /DNA_START=55 /DNA_END=423 /DNA_ORIENTATION=+
MNMLHHVSLPVSDLGRSKVLYDAMLGELEYRCVFANDRNLGYGVEDGKDKLCLKLRPGAHGADGFHLAFAAPSPAAVDAFYARALEHGATDCGAPGLRPYGANYYACFVFDLDGHRLEAVHK